MRAVGEEKRKGDKDQGNSGNGRSLVIILIMEREEICWNCIWNITYFSTLLLKWDMIDTIPELLYKKNFSELIGLNLPLMKFVLNMMPSYLYVLYMIRKNRISCYLNCHLILTKQACWQQVNSLWEGFKPCRFTRCSFHNFIFSLDLNIYFIFCSSKLQSLFQRMHDIVKDLWFTFHVQYVSH